MRLSRSVRYMRVDIPIPGPYPRFPDALIDAGTMKNAAMDLPRRVATRIKNHLKEQGIKACVRLLSAVQLPGNRVLIPVNIRAECESDDVWRQLAEQIARSLASTGAPAATSGPSQSPSVSSDPKGTSPSVLHVPGGQGSAAVCQPVVLQPADPQGAGAGGTEDPGTKEIVEGCVPVKQIICGVPEVGSSRPRRVSVLCHEGRDPARALEELSVWDLPSIKAVALEVFQVLGDTGDEGHTC